ncbi:ABC transporter ATP-binding protein [Halorussus salinus]|uniref:ABC transporter ATP-binding protein n=1 Tax=Halorussus salinus TaxID=1364935 RepID=UPI0010918DB1|nr:ABC transporter ATP-binding protein [Halorussus salinus]
MASVTLDNITHRYYEDNGDATVAVDDIALEIEDGEFVVFVGPSGCGKTTTLETIAGLLQPSEGTVRFGDRDVTPDPARKRDIAMVFQSYALYPHMTVKENMAFPLKQRQGITGEPAAQKVTEAAEMMGIDDLLDRMPSDLSGGQKQRVALGRAIVRDPDVFLMDEPLSNLDAKLRRQMRIELQELHSELGTTTIYVTHNQEEAMTMSDRIVIMNRGEIQQVGRPQEIYDDPANRFVAEFIGEPSMNFLDGHVGADGETIQLHNTTITVAGLTGASDAAVAVGIRPEEVELVSDGGDLTGEIRLIEPMGSHFEVQVEVGAGTSVTAMVDTETNLRTGDEVDIVMNESAVHVFDARSGEAYDVDRGPDSEVAQTGQ